MCLGFKELEKNLLLDAELIAQDNTEKNNKQQVRNRRKSENYMKSTEYCKKAFASNCCKGYFNSHSNKQY